MLVARHTLQMNDVRWNYPIANNRVNDVNVFTAWTGATGAGHNLTTTDHELPILPMSDNVEANEGRGPEGRARVHAWWNYGTGEQVSDALRASAVNANIPTRFTVPTGNADRGLDREVTSLSSPIEGSKSSTPLFFMNEAEVNVLLGQTTNGSRRTYRVDHETFGTAMPLEATNYWLRSHGSGTANVATVNTTGNWDAGAASNATANLSFRPAVWVRW